MVIFKHAGLSLDSVLNKASGLIGRNKPIISVYKTPRYNDEPQLFQYTAVIQKTSVLCTEGENDNLAGGTAVLKEKAIMKTLGEGIERYCLAIFQKKDLIKSSIRQLRGNYLDPVSVVNFSSSQLKNKALSDFKFHEDAELSWVKGYSMIQKKPIFVPAQLIYVPYHIYNEPVIRLPITTGAACGTSLEEAIFRGICEIVERDSFMIFYLNKLFPTRLDLVGSKNEFLITLSNNYKRYNLDLYVFDISTDLPLTSIMAIIVDRSGVGPAISVGLKCSTLSGVAIVGAIEEAQQIRSWIRDEMYKHKEAIVKSDSLDLKERGLYWSKLDRIKDLDFFLNSKNIIRVDEFIKTSDATATDFDGLIQMLKHKKLEAVFVDVTRPEVKKKGFVIVKVIMPQLQPLYLYENFKYLGGERLFHVPRTLGYKDTPKNEKELNPIPHPFL